MLIAAGNRTTKDTPAEARSYCERLVWLSFPDFEWDEGVLDICANEDRHFAPCNFRGGYLMCQLKLGLADQMHPCLIIFNCVQLCTYSESKMHVHD